MVENCNPRLIAKSLMTVVSGGKSLPSTVSISDWLTPHSISSLKVVLPTTVLSGAVWSESPSVEVSGAVLPLWISGTGGFDAPARSSV